MNNFFQRTLTGAVFVGVILASVWWGPVPFQLLFLLVTILSLAEFYRLNTSQQCEPLNNGGIAIGSAVYILLSFTASGHIPAKYLSLSVPLISLIFFIELYRKKALPFHNIAMTLTGVFYTAVPLALLTDFAHSDNGYDRALLMGYFVILWSSDSFAYVHGSLFGRNRLFERISPKKSWEGSILGGISTLAVAWGFSIFNPGIPLIVWLILAIIICITGTMGDLAESLMKRSLGVKDSGTILPGHGGILDRFDALFLSVPFVWAFMKIIH